MKDFFIKKIIPILSVLSIVLSLFCFGVSAETDKNDLYYKNITPSGMFFYIEDYNGKVFRFIDDAPNKVFDGNDYLYLSTLFLDSTQNIYGQNIFYCVNLLGDGFTFNQGVNYTLKFKVIVPTRYANDSTGFTFDVSGFSAGLFSWKSVIYSDRNNYFQALVSPQVEKWYNNEGFEWLNYPYEYTPSSGNVHTFSYIDIEAEFVPSKNTKMLSIGVTLPFGNVNRWNDYIGIGGLKIGMPKEYAPLPGGVPNYDSGNSDNMHNIENSINNQNQNNINASTDLFNGFGNLFTGNSRLLKGVTGVTAIFGKLFNGIDWVQSLLTFSLTLGLVAFLLGSGVSIYNQGHNKRVRAERRKNKGGGS